MAWMELRERENVPDPRGRAAASTTFLRWRRPRGQEAADLDQGAPHEGERPPPSRNKRQCPDSPKPPRLCLPGKGHCCHSIAKSYPALQLHGLQHARLPCPSLSPGVCSEIMSVESVLPSNHFILCHPLLLLSSVFPSIRVFSNESTLCIKWPKFWSFSFSPSNEYSGLISFRIDWFDLFAVQGILKSLLQHHNSKASIL